MSETIYNVLTVLAIVALGVANAGHYIAPDDWPFIIVVAILWNGFITEFDSGSAV